MPGWSNIGLFLQIAIVIVGVLVFSFFDPFGFLNTKKQTLEDTPISVQSIREIGKFISAEYYGEVLTSLQEAIIEEINSEFETDEIEIQSIWDQFEDAIYDLRERRNSIKLGLTNRGKKLNDIFYHDYQILTQHPYYQPFIVMIGGKNEKKLIKELFNAKDTKIENLLAQKKGKINTAVFETEKNKQLEIITADKKFRKSQIVVLGRGWVKAGIDFKAFNENNFKYDKENKTIHLVGMKPEILFSTINPWFIPEKQIKGFEIVVITRKARKPEYMQKVKHLSLEKLRQNAIRAGILKQAKANAEENLKNFFSLLIPDGIDQVVIHDSFFSYFDASFMSDSLSATIMQSVDSLFIQRYTSDSAAVISLRDSLKNKKIYLLGKGYPVNRFSSRLGMAEDEVISEGEMKWMINEKNQLKKALDNLNDNIELSRIGSLPDRLDSIWFFPGQIVVDKYWQEVNDTSMAKFSRLKIISDSEDYLEDKRKRRNAVVRKVYIYITRKKISTLEELSMIVRSNVKQIVKGEKTYILEDSNVNATTDERTLEYVTSLDGQLDIIGDSGVHSKKYLTSRTVTFEELEEATRVMVNNWETDSKCVYKLRDNIFKNWKLSFDSSQTISRYSVLYQYIRGDTLSDEGLPLLEEEEKMINQSDSLINKVALEDQSHLVLSRTNEIIDKVWYYPSEDRIDEFERAAKARKYGFFTRGKSKKKLKALYKEFLIQRFILNKRREEFTNVQTKIKSSSSQ